MLAQVIVVTLCCRRGNLSPPKEAVTVAMALPLRTDVWSRGHLTNTQLTWIVDLHLSTCDLYSCADYRRIFRQIQTIVTSPNPTTWQLLSEGSGDCYGRGSGHDYATRLVRHVEDLGQTECVCWRARNLQRLAVRVWDLVGFSGRASRGDVGLCRYLCDGD